MFPKKKTTNGKSQHIFIKISLQPTASSVLKERNAGQLRQNRKMLFLVHMFTGCGGILGGMIISVN